MRARACECGCKQPPQGVIPDYLGDLRGSEIVGEAESAIVAGNVWLDAAASGGAQYRRGVVPGAAADTSTMALRLGQI